MEIRSLLLHLARTLDSLRIPWFVTGSMASGAYGEPRMTNDIDVVVRLSLGQLDAFLAAFPEDDYYYNRDAAIQAVRDHFQFNIINSSAGNKVDVMIASDSEYDRCRFARCGPMRNGIDPGVIYASPEDVVLKKLMYFREGGSEKHLRDVVGILAVSASEIDRTYLADWIARLGVEAQWQLVQTRMTKSD